MDAGTTVYKPYVGDILFPDGLHVMVSEGTVTDIVANGIPLVRFGKVLQAFDTGWFETRDEAMRYAVTVLADRVRVLHDQMDTLRTGLRNEGAAA